MATGFISRMIRRTYRNQLIVLVVLFVLLIAAMVPALNYYANVLSGPAEITPEELVGIRDVSHLDHFYITLHGDAAYPIGEDILVWSDGTRSETNVRYATLPIGSYKLLIKTPGDPTANEFTGTLSEIPPDACRILIQNCALSAYLPMMLNTGDFRLTGFFSLAVVILLGIGLVTAMLYTRRQMQNPAGHPLLRHLKPYGDPMTIANQIDAELKAEGEPVGKIHLTKHWLIYPAFGTMSVTKLSDVIWFYKAVINHRTNGAHTGTNVSMWIWDRNGTCVTITDFEGEVNAIIEALGKRVPWAIKGYSKEIEYRYKNDRQSLIVEIDRRKWGVTIVNRN